MDEQAFIRDYIEVMHCAETSARSVFMLHPLVESGEEPVEVSVSTHAEDVVGVGGVSMDQES